VVEVNALDHHPELFLWDKQTNSKINSVNTTAAKALTSPGFSRAMTVNPVRPHRDMYQCNIRNSLSPNLVDLTTEP
jgi:hypothetical protein